MLGIAPYPFEGDEDSNLINTGKETVKLQTGGCFFDGAESIVMIRGAKRVVQRIITNYAVLDVTHHGLVLREVAAGHSVEEIQNITEPKLIIPKEGVSIIQTEHNRDEALL